MRSGREAKRALVWVLEACVSREQWQDLAPDSASEGCDLWIIGQRVADEFRRLNIAHPLYTRAIHEHICLPYMVTFNHDTMGAAGWSASCGCRRR